MRDLPSELTIQRICRILAKNRLGQEEVTAYILALQCCLYAGQSEKTFIAWNDAGNMAQEKATLALHTNPNVTILT